MLAHVYLETPGGFALPSFDGMVLTILPGS